MLTQCLAYYFPGTCPTRLAFGRYMMVKVTFVGEYETVRHGESTDNLRVVWGGWKDAPLTNHGMKQAEALALSFASTAITAIYSSDLQRAHMTAKAIKAAQPSPIPLHTNELLREQYFGAAEGQSFKVKRDKAMTLVQHFAKGLFPTLYSRDERFPGGESKDEVAARAKRFFEEMLMPYVLDEKKDDGGQKKLHIVVVSHGLFIPELITLMAMKDEKIGIVEGNIRGDLHRMKNTAWTRVEFSFKTCENEATFKIKFLNVNAHPHLLKLKRQTGGIGRLKHDPAQKDIRSFLK